MNQTDCFSLLICPYCHHGLSLTTYTEGHGIAVCRCDQYPIIKNVVYLKKHDNGKHVLCCRLIGDGRYWQACRLLFDEPFVLRQCFYVVDFLLNILPFVKPKTDTIFKLVSYLYPSRAGWYRYLGERTGRITYALSLATISQIRNRQTVVDAGCGLGQFLKTATVLMPTANYIGIDMSFSLLCFARRLVVPGNLILVCADLNDGIPLAGESVDRMYFNDSFMYVKQHNKLINEIIRSLCKSGMAFFNHVHDRYAENAGQGFGVTPQDMIGYAGKTLLLYASDTEMAGNIFNKNHIVYHRPAGNEYEPVFRSYSYLLTKLRLNKYEFKLKKQLLPLIRINTDSDPEDPELTECINL